jgi:hypothetical protein
MGELIVLFKDEVTVEEIKQTIEDRGLTLIDIMKETMEKEGVPTFMIPPLCLVRVPSGMEKEWIKKLKVLPNISCVEENVIVHT